MIQSNQPEAPAEQDKNDIFNAVLHHSAETPVQK
jgi:hypothetical protein